MLIFRGERILLRDGVVACWLQQVVSQVTCVLDRLAPALWAIGSEWIGGGIVSDLSSENRMN